ncbi:SUMF1/EgtB/PvdO family nonheme iron enzyme [bacterium]|nr:SUMF1/EgtB/PvdO family nonheme iron enzyme [bacterium]
MRNLSRWFLGAGLSAIFLCLLPGSAVSLEEKTIELPGLSKNSVPLVMVKIPAGSFLMGSPPSEKYREYNEGPQHKVIISQDFYIGKYEVTQAQWKTLMEENPSVFTGDELPVNKVSWLECMEFILKLRQLKDEEGFRLPTEAEHEYVCRAGTTGTTFFGDTPAMDTIMNYVWFRRNSDYEVHPVGTLKPNPWGLYDIMGNVWEWCSDWYYFYEEGEQIDPQGPKFGRDKVIRGPSWMGRKEWVRCADRGKFPPDEAYHTGGFRIVYQEK